MMMMMNNDIEIQDDNVTARINRMLQEYYYLNPSASIKGCIYRIPENLRRLNEAAYTPQAVSIGPIHYDEFKSGPMGRYKVGYLHAFLQRTEKTSPDVFIHFIYRQNYDVINCYKDRVVDKFMLMRQPEFGSMLLLDGIFIIEYLIMARGTFGGATEVHPNRSLYQRMNIESDLILLENQLPFFLLEGLYNLAFPTKGDDIPSFLELACDYFSQYNSDMNDYIKHESPPVQHFTDLLRNFLLPHQKLLKLRTLQRDRTKKAQWSKSATVLHESGVKFMVGKGRTLCDIHFNDGVLQIPCFTFQSSTESLFRNLTAFEQYHYPYETYISHYLFFMDNLINTAKDVDILVENGIIINSLGDSEAVADLLNRITRNVLVVGHGLYAEPCEALNAHCEVGWHSWKVSFKRDYFSTPWKIASTTAAIILLVLTAIQTICSIISLV